MGDNKSRTTRESGTHAAIYPSQRALARRELPVAVVGCCTPGSRVHVFAVASEVSHFGCHLRVGAKHQPADPAVLLPAPEGPASAVAPCRRTWSATSRRSRTHANRRNLSPCAQGARGHHSASSRSGLASAPAA